MNIRSVENYEVETETLQFLSFTSGDEQYGIDLISVREIKSWEETTSLPNSPEFMKGIVNLRGMVVPIFDLRKRFNQGDTEICEKKSVVIVIAIEEKHIGILVDAVSDILTADSNDIKATPDSGESSIENTYINGFVSMEDKMVILLNTKNLFDAETIEQAERAIK